MHRPVAAHSSYLPGLQEQSHRVMMMMVMMMMIMIMMVMMMMMMIISKLSSCLL
jgi:hypothetical protein